MKLIGLTGGIGMGKSTVAGMLAKLGVPVVDTDLLARQVVEPGQPALEEIVSTFGAGVLDQDGRLNRAEMARRVFSDESKRRQLESILHPRIRAAWKSQVETWRAEGRPSALVVIPLLFETAAEPEFDAVVGVACTGETQRQRLCKRGWSDEQIRQRNAAQWPVDRKLALAHHVVWTEGDFESTRAQTIRLFARWRAT